MGKYGGSPWRPGGLVFSRGGAGEASERTKPKGKNSTGKMGGKKKVRAVKNEVSVPGRDIIYSFNAFIRRAEVVFTLS